LREKLTTMFRPRSGWVLVPAWALVLASSRLSADVVWSGLGINTNWTTPANWDGGSIPANNGTEQIRFESAQRGTVLVNTSPSIRRLRFDFTAGGTRVYSLSGSGTTLTLGSDGIEVDSGASGGTRLAAGVLSASEITSGGVVTFSSSLGLILAAPQTWSVDSDSTLQVASAISGSGPLALTDGGYIGLWGSNTYTGGTNLQSSVLGLDNNSALGTGPLTVSGSSTIYSLTGARTLTNALNLNSSLLDLLPYGGDFVLTGPVTLGTSTTIRNDGYPVHFTGAVGETGGARSLTLSGSGAFVLSGANTYSGGTHVFDGALFFSNTGAVPAVGSLSNGPQGYIGIAFNTGVQSNFVAKFSPANTSGTLGFDTALGAANATVFSEPVNLSALNAFARIGSATRATFSPTALITPAVAGGYRFGGGGGTLRVESKLTGANGLTVDSSRDTELTVVVAGTTHDYTGLTSSTSSALVFDTGAISSGSAAGSFVLGNAGYIGSMDPNVTLANWLAKFSAATVSGVIGLDSSNVNSPRTVSGVFNLSTFTGGTSIALGTASAAILSGSITLPALQNNYQLTGYKGGWLTVDAVLNGTRGLELGSASGQYPDFDPNDSSRMSTVFLNGSNSHTAGTTLFSGRLVVGQANALGTGIMTVDGRGARSNPRFESSLLTNPTFSNQLVVKSAFYLGGVNSFTWAGAIVDGTSTGTIRKHGSSNLTISGNNTGFSGGFTIDEGTITFASNTAAGTGGLNLGFSSGLAAFTTVAPSISQLSSQSTTARVSVATGTTLAINQATDSTFRGQIQGGGGIAKSGTGVLRLETASSFTGGTTITAGTIDAASTGALGSNTITLNGTTANLKVEPSVTLANSLVFGGAGGRLSGHGSFSSNVVVGTNSVIGPGNSIGTLSFTNGLTFASGGIYEFEVQDALAGPGVGWDFVQVSGPLTFTATPTAPFTLNLISLSSSGAIGNPANFSSNNSYSWAIASATSFVGFNPAALSINPSGFTASLNGGAFSFSTSGSNLLLNFTPVPEPSTWILLLTGLGLAGFRKLRRRR
jgi:autotransporter-associated beta strand protein